MPTREFVVRQLALALARARSSARRERRERARRAGAATRLLALAHLQPLLRVERPVDGALNDGLLDTAVVELDPLPAHGVLTQRALLSGSTSSSAICLGRRLAAAGRLVGRLGGGKADRRRAGILLEVGLLAVDGSAGRAMWLGCCCLWRSLFRCLVGRASRGANHDQKPVLRGQDRAASRRGCRHWPSTCLDHLPQPQRGSAGAGKLPRENWGGLRSPGVV